MPKHVDYTGWTVTYDYGDQSNKVTVTTAKVVAAKSGDTCESCDKAAVYVVDAESLLGQGGYNVAYCQACAAAQVLENNPETADYGWDEPSPYLVPEACYPFDVYVARLNYGGMQ
jgi:hypothetical protein